MRCGDVGLLFCYITLHKFKISRIDENLEILHGFCISLRNVLQVVDSEGSLIDYLT